MASREAQNGTGRIASHVFTEGAAVTQSRLLPLFVLAVCGTAYPQGAKPTLEGYWQDTARRILYARGAPASYAYSEWTALDPTQTYPAAKRVQRGDGGWKVIDLNFDDADYSVRTVGGSDTHLEFVRTVKWTGCAMHHRCVLQGEEMVCALDNLCPLNGESVLDWRGEERYVRRMSRERQGRVQLQGYPVACR